MWLTIVFEHVFVDIMSHGCNHTQCKVSQKKDILSRDKEMNGLDLPHE
jgi:hypothetical protein